MFRDIKLKVNPFLIIFLIFWAITGMLAEVLVILVIIFVHEMAHTLVARGFGIPVKEIELYPFGGVARTEGLLEIEPGIERKIAWAGPLANFLMVALALTFYSNRLYLGPWNEETAIFFIRANLFLAFFNLIPALPLDGGRILRSVLSDRYNYRNATVIAVRLGKVLSVFVFAGGLVLWYLGYFNLSFLVLAVFIFLAASREQTLAVYAFLNSLGLKEREIRRKGGLRGEQIIVNEDATLLEIFKLFSPNRYHLVRVINGGTRRLRGEIPENQLIEAALKKGLHTPVKKIL